MAQRIVSLLFILAFTCCGCSRHKQKVYTSDCAPDLHFKKVKFVNLIDSISQYDKQFVEVSGRYMEGKNMSSLVNDSTFTEHDNSHALWVNFTQDCPLYLTDKHTGLFETEDGEYNKLNNRLITVRGRVEVQKKGHKNAYRATLNEIVYLALQ